MAENDPDSSGKARRSPLINDSEGRQVHASIDLSPFPNTTIHHLYPTQHFPSYETNSAYGYYAPNSTNVYHHAGEGWSDYLRLNKQTTATYSTTQPETGTTYEDTSSYFPPARSVDAYIPSVSYTPTTQQYSSQPTTDQQYSDDGQYYSYTNRTHTSSYGLPSYPQHFLQPLDPYAGIFPPSVISTNDGKLKEPKSIPEDTAYSPGLYRVTDTFAQLSFTPDDGTQQQPTQNGSFREPTTVTVPQAAPAAPVVTEPVYTEPVVEQTKKPRSYADALTRPRTATKPVAPVPRARPAGTPSTKPSSAPPAKPLGKKSSIPVRPSPTRNGAPAPSQTGFKSNQSSSSSQVRRRPTNPLAKKLEVNPENFDTNVSDARFFVIKSYSADDVHKSIKYGVWTSTKHGNKRLDQAFTESGEKGPIFLFFSVNGSGCFCGMAEMKSNLDYDKSFSAWSQDDKWSGQFEVKWIYIKNIPNKRLRHIRLVNNNNKSVTNSRDTQEVFLEPGRQVLKVFHSFEHSFSILDDFEHFDRLEDAKKPKATDSEEAPSSGSSTVPVDDGFVNTAPETFDGAAEESETNPVEVEKEKKQTSESTSNGSSRGGGSSRGRGGFRRGGGGSGGGGNGGGTRPKSFSEVSRDSETQSRGSGGRSSYVPTQRGRGRGGGTFVQKAKPKPALPQ